MSPEAILDKTYSIKSDVWSFGIVLFELITRKEPYEEWDAVQAATKVCMGQLRPDITPEFLKNEIVKAIYNIMLTCVLADPNQRPNMKGISLALEEINSQNPRPTSTMAPTPPPRGSTITPAQQQQLAQQLSQAGNKSSLIIPGNKDSVGQRGSVTPVTSKGSLPPRPTSNYGRPAVAAAAADENNNNSGTIYANSLSTGNMSHSGYQSKGTVPPIHAAARVQSESHSTYSSLGVITNRDSINLDNSPPPVKRTLPLPPPSPVVPPRGGRDNYGSSQSAVASANSVSSYSNASSTSSNANSTEDPRNHYTSMNRDSRFNN